MRYLTAGESHGKGLTAIIEGLPSNLKVDINKINDELSRRQSGYGRGGRMKIETDTVEILSGVRNSYTLGSPLALFIKNRDFSAWEGVMGEGACDVTQRTVTALRPGHADYSGSVKYNFSDARNVLERASARETAARVAVGAISKQFLAELGIFTATAVVGIGEAMASDYARNVDLINNNVEKNDMRTYHQSDATSFKLVIDKAIKDGDTVGGIAEVVIAGVPVGVGSHVHYDRKLSTKLFGAAGSIQSVKCVEIGLGKDSALRFGSKVHDEMQMTDGKLVRRSNNAGGIEGGISNGEDIILRAAFKPIPTVMSGLDTVDLKSKNNVKSSTERSDYCAVPAAAVVLENVAAFTVADAVLEVLGGDDMQTIKKRMLDMRGRVW